MQASGELHAGVKPIRKQEGLQKPLGLNHRKLSPREHVFSRRDHPIRESNTTTWAATPSPRPAKPSFSVVFPLMFTHAGSQPRSLAMWATIAGAWGVIFGVWQITVASMFTTSKPCRCTTFQA